WSDYLDDVLWAIRSTSKSTTGMTPAKCIYGDNHVLPIELELPTWQTLQWTDIRDTAGLIAMRAQQ
ncbi:hypothetical protein K402DRAFT_306055, partial [Aulographum hederae CBS 113979]